MVFQEPLIAFNPVFTIGYQIEEVLQVHTPLNRLQRQKRILELLDRVGLPEPKQTAMNYPHQLSGGMRQRAMIAQAIAAGPKLIIADEPTSNLDVTLQANIIELFRKLKDELKLSILLITHDLGMVAHMADQVVVMTQGRVVEEGATKDVLNNPAHAYTKELMEALLM
jgi:ABC-type dipeptide/oligopeptide/nickel transport system ATPase component